MTNRQIVRHYLIFIIFRDYLLSLEQNNVSWFFLGLMKRKTSNRELIAILLLLIFKLRVRDDDVEIIWSAQNRSEVTLTLLLKI